MFETRDEMQLKGVTSFEENNYEIFSVLGRRVATNMKCQKEVNPLNL